jgi:hypothetical protein
VHVSPSAVTSGENVRLTVAAGIAPAPETVELDVPYGLKAEAGDLSYDLGPGEHAEFIVRVTSVDDRPRFLSARIGDGYGQLLEDTVTVGGPPPSPSPASRSPRTVAPARARPRPTFQDFALRAHLNLLTLHVTWSDKPGHVTREND